VRLGNQVEFQPLDFFPFLYTSKASTAEREDGLEDFEPASQPHNLSSNACANCGLRIKANGSGIKCECGDKRETMQLARRNTHPTVKPLSVMAWLLKLVTPPGGIVVDPFAGSGTTLVAAASLGIRAVGIELDPSHVAIARARLANAVAATTPTRNGGVVTSSRRSSKRMPTATLPMFAAEVTECR